MARIPAIGALVAVLALAGVATAQGAGTEATVEVDDATIAGKIVPLDEPGTTTTVVRVGCQTAEVAGTRTEATLSPQGFPDWANVIVSPSSLTWQTSPGDCPAREPPFQGETQLSISLTQDAEAYEPTRGAIVAEVTKTPPEGPGETYGTGQGNVTFTPGYFQLFNVRMDTKIQEVGPNETATFEGGIENFSNHETRFTFTAQPLEDEPARLVVPGEPIEVGPQASESLELRIVPGEVGPTGATVQAEVAIDAASTHPDGGEEGTEPVNVTAKFRPAAIEAVREAPAPGLPAGILLVVGAAVGLRRQGSKPSKITLST
jgi:hypothetical protein